MEPHFHSGDLALVRSQSSYHVGEIVAYHSNAFHTIVLHRIVGRAGDRYVFKGDNNNFVDFEHPARSQLIGALWLHVPGVGARLESLRSPGSDRDPPRRRARSCSPERRSPRGAGGAGAGSAAPPTSSGRHARRAWAAPRRAGRSACSRSAWSRCCRSSRSPCSRSRAPRRRLLPFAVPYKQSGSLSYTAHAAPGPIYRRQPRGHRRTAVHPRRQRPPTLRFGYRFRTRRRHSLAGRLRSTRRSPRPAAGRRRCSWPPQRPSAAIAQRSTRVST